MLFGSIRFLNEYAHIHTHNSVIVYVVFLRMYFTVQQKQNNKNARSHSHIQQPWLSVGICFFLLVWVCVCVLCTAHHSTHTHKTIPLDEINWLCKTFNYGKNNINQWVRKRSGRAHTTNSYNVNGGESWRKMQQQHRFLLSILFMSNIPLDLLNCIVFFTVHKIRRRSISKFYAAFFRIFWINAMIA